MAELAMPHGVEPHGVEPHGVELHGVERQGGRLDGIDAARALALFGVITMNYIVVWNGSAIRWSSGSTVFTTGPLWLRELLDPLRGPLTTRFAATFMTIAGIGIGLGTMKAAQAGRATVVEHRWRLRRRGVALFLIGSGFVWFWPGEILHYYGFGFVAVSFLVGRSRHWLWAGLIAVLAASIAVRAYVFVAYTSARTALTKAGIDTESPAADAARRRFANLSWISRFSARGDIDGLLRDEHGGLVYDRVNLGSWRGLIVDLGWGGTHPVLPWMGFLLVGMLVAPSISRRRGPLALVVGGLCCIGAGWGIALAGRSMLPERWSWMASTNPFEPNFAAPFGLAMPPYFLGACGGALAGVGLVLLASRALPRWPRQWILGPLAQAGQCTLSLYLLHGLAFSAAENFLRDPTVGLVNSLEIAAATWSALIVAAVMWRAKFRHGPIESVLRRFCDQEHRPAYSTSALGAPE